MPVRLQFPAPGSRTTKDIPKEISRLISGPMPGKKSKLEYRIDWGPGYRAYFGRDGGVLVILLTGGTKEAAAARYRRSSGALETFVAIRNLRTAIESTASGAEVEALLLRAIEAANRWIRHAQK